MSFFRFQYIVRAFFCDLGRFIARCPLPFILLPTAIAIACSVGIYLNKNLMNINYETSLNDFFPESSQSWQNMQSLKRLFFMERFTSFTGISFLFLKKNLAYVIMTSNRLNGSVIGEHGLRCASDLIGRIKEIKVVHNGIQYSWPDVCLRTQEGLCGEHPITQTLSLLKETYQIFPSMQPLLYYPTVTIDGYYVDNTPIFGGAKARQLDGVLMKATALRIPFFLREVTDEDGAEVNNLWRKAFLETVANINYPGYSLYWCTWLSLIEEIQRNCDDLILYLPYLALILLIMTVGGCCDGDFITSKPWLGVCGLISASFAILTAIGILFYCQYSYIPMVIIMPFLVLSVSVDNVFLMLSAWRATKSTNTVEDRTAESLGDSAVSILITALTDCLSFSVGNLTPFPAVQIFCTYCALALLCTFVYQMTFFAALLALEGRREASSRHCITYRIIYKKLASPHSKDSIAADSSKGWRNFDKYNEIFSSSLAAMISSPICKMFILFLYTVYVASFSYGIATIGAGLNVEHLLPRRSYVSRTLKVNDRLFSAYGDFATVFINQTLHINDKDDLEKLLNIYRSLTSTKFSAIGEFWLADVVSYGRSRNESLQQHPYRTEILLNNFFSDPRYQHYLNDVNFDEDSFLIVKSTRMSIRLRNCGRANYSQIANILRRRFVESALSGFVFHPSFLLVDQDYLVEQTLLQDIIAAIIAMIIVLMLFIPTCCSVAWVAVSIVSICLGVIGMLSLWKVQIDIVSMITITMSVGLSVDYISHMTYYYTSAFGSTPYDRLVVAYRHVGVPTVQSGLLAISGVSALIFLESHMVETFVKTVFLVVVIGMFHGLLFLPALLSTFMKNVSEYLSTLGTPGPGSYSIQRAPPTMASDHCATVRPEDVRTRSRTVLGCADSVGPIFSTQPHTSPDSLPERDMYLANMFNSEAEPKEITMSIAHLKRVTSPLDLLDNLSKTDGIRKRELLQEIDTSAIRAALERRQHLTRRTEKGDHDFRPALNTAPDRNRNANLP